MITGYDAAADGPLTVTPDGCVIAVGLGPKIRLVDTQTGQTVHEFASGQQQLTSAVFSPDGSLLATGGDDGTVRVWAAARTV
jgi:WD40 repeat protein